MCFTCLYLSFALLGLVKSNIQSPYVAVLMDTLRNTYCVMESINHVCVTAKTSDEAIQVMDRFLVELVL